MRSNAVQCINDTTCRVIAFLGWFQQLYGESTGGSRRSADLPTIPRRLLDELHRSANILEGCVRRFENAGEDSTPDPQDIDANDPATMYPSDIAVRYRVPLEPLRKRLERWRISNTKLRCIDWYEVPDRKPRQEKYLYRVGAIRDRIRAPGASAKHPAKK
jgi:hypothetical protein